MLPDMVIGAPRLELQKCAHGAGGELARGSLIPGEGRERGDNDEEVEHGLQGSGQLRPRLQSLVVARRGFQGHEQPAADKRGAALASAGRDEQDGDNALGHDLLGDAPEEQSSQAAPAMGAHDHEVRGQLLGVLDNAPGDVAHLSGMYVALDGDIRSEGVAPDLFEVVEGLIRSGEMGMPVHGSGRVLLDDVKKGDRSVQSPGQAGGNGQGGFGESRTIKRD